MPASDSVGMPAVDDLRLLRSQAVQRVGLGKAHFAVWKAWRAHDFGQQAEHFRGSRGERIAEHADAVRAGDRVDPAAKALRSLGDFARAAFDCALAE